MNARAVTNPMHGGNAFKLGVFSANCDGGLSMSMAPERWKADWDENLELCRISDRAGFDFILPVAKWHGYAGKANNYGRSFETLTHGAAIGAVTEKIAIFCTVHVPLVTPAFVAKAIATIDHVTHGRVGLNIVCGWNQDEFSMHGIKIDPERRYDQGLEWFRIFAKLLSGGPAFDWDGEFYKLQGLETNPLSVQKPWPVIMSAGFSPKGRDFAAQAADAIFTNMTELEQGPALVENVRAHAARYQRKIDVYTMTHVVCRPTRKEAEDYYYYFAEEMADRESLDYYKRQKGLTSKADPRFVDRPLMTRFTRSTGKTYSGSYPGALPLVGTPDDIAAELAKLHSIGLAGASVSFLNYLTEIPYFIQEVLPRLARAGLRTA